MSAPADTQVVEHPEETWSQMVADSLHDGPMQTVVSVSLELDGLSKAIGSHEPPSADEVRDTLERLRSANQHAASELRAIVRQLSDPSGAGASDGSSFDRLVPTNGSGGQATRGSGREGGMER